MRTNYTTIRAAILWILLVCSVSCQNSAGKFGAPCVYNCRCSTPCDVSGSCTNNGRCQGGWFGPECQYVDLAYNRARDPVITDGYDVTCVSSSNTDTVTIGLDKPYPFTWLRVRLSDSRQGVLDSLQVEFMTNNSRLSCVNPRNATVDDTTIDIHCDLKTTVQSVILSGEGTKYLCSVYISGGRNVALNQATSQSSTRSENNDETGNVLKYFPSSNAVDGDTSRYFYEGNGCTHTKPGVPNPSWEVTFSKPQYVNRFVIYNRVGYDKFRLVGFRLESFDTSRNQVLNYKDVNTAPLDIYHLTFVNLTSPVSQVKISVSNNESILTLCEVEIYGDTSCQFGQCGRDCEYSCHCFGNETCFVSTGGCPSGCAVGYTGSSCNKECGPGKYGRGCSMSCSNGCTPTNKSDESPCHHVYGVCLLGCLPGYTTSLCIEETPSQPSQTGLIVGITVAVVVVIAVIVIILVVTYYRRQMRTRRSRQPRVYDIPGSLTQDEHTYDVRLKPAPKPENSNEETNSKTASKYSNTDQTKSQAEKGSEIVNDGQCVQINSNTSSDNEVTRNVYNEIDDTSNDMNIQSEVTSVNS